MLEVRYHLETKQLSAWCGDEKQFGNLDYGRDNEAIVVLDIPIPSKPLDAWLFDTDKLIPNPSYVEPEPPRNLEAEIDELKTIIDNITKVNGVA